MRTCVPAGTQGEDARHTMIARYHDAVSRLDALIEHGPKPDDKSRPAVQQRAERRMARLRRFLAHLGDPLSGYPIVHVGGTSGKGSTSTTIAAILSAAGYRTGLHTSPYLQTAAEKLQLDGRLIDPDLFVELTDTVLAAHEEWRQAGGEPLTYGEAWIALTALFFHHHTVDLAVVEVGAGGRFDLTNILTPAISVITSVGIDHTATLGDTIDQIAWHKAGIIKPGAPAVTAAQDPVAVAIIAGAARDAGVPLTRVIPGETFEVCAIRPDGTDWRDLVTGEQYHMGLAGRFQAINGATALATVRVLRGRGFDIPDSAVQEGLAAARIAGRAERVQERPAVMLDGAHNPEKVGALAADLPELLPTSPGGRRIVVLGALEAKQADEMIARIAPATDVLVATSPQVLAKHATAADRIGDIARSVGFAGEIIAEPEPARAIVAALGQVRDPSRDAVLVTGSLYLVGNVRSRWYRDDEIVAQQTCWPRAETGNELTESALRGGAAS